ncbi:hypothetical protein [Enterococcus mundtii]|uniref:hypothetical protein n=1 Tax=Enterococcus mundtii TaxID=53346 RepID=UPI0035BECB13
MFGTSAFLGTLLIGFVGLMYLLSEAEAMKAKIKWLLLFILLLMLFSLQRSERLLLVKRKNQQECPNHRTCYLFKESNTPTFDRYPVPETDIEVPAKQDLSDRSG